MTKEEIDTQNEINKLYSENVELRKNYYSLLKTSQDMVNKLKSEIQELKS